MHLALTAALFSAVSATFIQHPWLPLDEPLYFFKFRKVPLEGSGLETLSTKCIGLEHGIAQNHRLLSTQNPLDIVRQSAEDYMRNGVPLVTEIVQLVGLNYNIAKQAVIEECWDKLRYTVDQSLVSFSKEFGAQETFPLEASKETGADQIEKIIDSGPPSNRIDVVFMGDGYTLAEKTKFFDDIKRLAKDMWSQTTFASVRPLVNVWAVFRASAQSGIGVGGQPKNTAFGLYRDGTELRGVYCSKPRAAREACKLTGPYACDFPSLIGNDDYYGGLGGEFTISTRSLLSGTVVLRHELGHNFIYVGEEYDNGQVYSGVNSAPVKTLHNLKWKHWLTDPEHPQEQKSVQRLAKYPWYDLAQGPISFTFQSDGTFSRWMLRVSASGVAEEGSLEVWLDGQKLDWKPRGDFDRAFYDYSDNKGFSKGTHTLEFRQGFPPVNSTAPIRQLCNLDLNEYAAEPEFHMNNSYISAYPTLDMYGRKTYRPTNEGCLMRNMGSRQFCSVCMEGMWLRFLQRVSLLDNVSTLCTASGVQISATLVPLAHLRPVDARRQGESYIIQWFKENVQVNEFAGKTDITVPSEPNVQWKIYVQFKTPEIRQDTAGLTTATKIVNLPQC